MISIDETREMLEELAAELPEPFFRELNGGISLLPEAKLSPIARAEDLYIMGEYLSLIHIWPRPFRTALPAC